MSLLELSHLERGDQVPDLCPHCGHRTSLEVEANIQVAPTWRNPQLMGTVQMWVPPLAAYQLIRPFRCMYCGKTTLVWLSYATVNNVQEMNRPATEAAILWPLR